MHLQNVTNDTNRPHVGGEGDAIKVNDFRSNKLGRAKENLKWNVTDGRK